jgi:hypothetical protein
VEAGKETEYIVGTKDGMQKSKFLHLLLNGSHASSSSSSEGRDAVIKVRDVDPDEGPRAPKKNFVDGDLIVRFFDGDVLARGEDAEDSLFDLVTMGTDPDIYQRFAKLAAAVGIRFDIYTGAKGVVENVGEWMEGVFREVL